MTIVEMNKKTNEIIEKLEALEWRVERPLSIKCVKGFMLYYGEMKQRFTLDEDGLFIHFSDTTYCVINPILQEWANKKFKIEICKAEIKEMSLLFEINRR